MPPSTPRALVRAISADFARAVVQDALGRDRPPDVPRARQEHAAYVDGLRWLGFAVHALPPLDRAPDATFVEDVAVVLGATSLMTRLGAPSRRAEGAAVEAWLRAQGLAVSSMDADAPATLEGGDVLAVGRTLLVGLSSRTNAAGARALAAAAEPAGWAVRAVPVRAGLHLKGACSAPAQGLVVAARGVAAPEWFDGLDAEVLWIPRGEAYAANTVGRGGRVLVAAGFPETAHALRAAGLAVRAVPMDEIARADGSLTCLSIRLGSHTAPREGFPREGFP